MSLLHVGDIVSLYSNGFLSTLGLVDDRCVLQPAHGDHGSLKSPPKKFRDCLFKVCIQHKYDVQSELWRSGVHIDDDELYKKLYSAAKSEQESNQEKNQLKRGQVVKYEDIVQLLHIKSNKFITVNAKAPAPEDKDATRVYLDANGNEGSWFKVKSPYKYRSNGEDVVCESIALVSDLGGLGAALSPEPLYLHASGYNLLDNPDCLEINANHQSTSWDVKPFLDYTQDIEDFLKGGHVVRLFHTDQEKFLTMDTYNSDDTQHVFLRSTDRAKATSATSSKALWEVEVVHPDPCRAGLARWSSLIRLKHLATERFLAADQDDDPQPDPMRDKLRKGNSPVYKLISLEYSYDYSTLFEFDSTTTNQTNSDNYIPINSNVTLKHQPTGTYVHSTNIYIDKDKKKSCMSKVGCAQNKGLDEVFAVIPVAATEIRDLDFVYDAYMLLNEAYELIKDNDATNIGREDAHRKLSELLPEIIHFIANKEGDPRKIEKAMSVCAENPNRERQKLIREQNVLKILFDILKLEEECEEPNKDICRLCYRVLNFSFQDYRKNQEYIVKWDKFIQSQFGKDINAEFTHSSLFNSNKNLLEKCISYQDIDIYVKLIRDKRQSSFLNCLSDLCITSKGSVCPTTQKLVCEAILHPSNQDILIETKTDNSVRGGQILLSTCHWRPDLQVSFEQPHHQSMANLSQSPGLGSAANTSRKQRLKVSQLTRPLKETILSSRNGSKLDAFILDYYRCQLDLFSAMCIGRQNKAIELLAAKLPLKMIQSCISDSELPCELRASFCRLLLHLHLICEPQRAITPVELRRKLSLVPHEHKLSVHMYDEYSLAKIGGLSLAAKQETELRFRETMEFVELYLSDLASISQRSTASTIFYNTEKNKLTYQVVNLNRELTYFGFYKLSDFLRLAEILLIILEDDKNQQPLVMRTKTKIIEILQYMSDVRLDYMVTSLLTIFKSSLLQEVAAASSHRGGPQQATTGLSMSQQELAGAVSITSSTTTTTSGGPNAPAPAPAAPTKQPTSSTSSNNTSSPLATANSSNSSQIAIKSNQELDEHLRQVNLDNSGGRKFVNVLLKLVKHDCPDLVSASLKLLLNYRSQRAKVLETFRSIELLDTEFAVRDTFRKLHPLIERSDRYIRRGRDDNHAAVSDVLVHDSKLISYIIAHIQYLIKNKDEERLTMELLRLLKVLMPLDGYSCAWPPTEVFGGAVGARNQRSRPGSPAADLGSHPGSAGLLADTLSADVVAQRGPVGGRGAAGARDALGAPLGLPVSLVEMQNRLDAHGASSLIVELIAMGSSSSDEKVRQRSATVFKDTLALAIALLEGGNAHIQASLHDKLTKKSELDKAERFFEVLSNRMNLAQQALSPATGGGAGAGGGPGGGGGGGPGGPGGSMDEAAAAKSPLPARLRRSNLQAPSGDTSSMSVDGLGASGAPGAGALAARCARQLSQSATDQRLALTDSFREELDSTIDITEKALAMSRNAGAARLLVSSTSSTSLLHLTNGAPAANHDDHEQHEQQLQRRQPLPDEDGKPLRPITADSGYSATPTPADEPEGPAKLSSDSSGSGRDNSSGAWSGDFGPGRPWRVGGSSRLPEVIRVMQPILRLLQLLCEDHNLTMQNYVRSQPLNKSSYNLVAKTLVFLNCLCGSKEGSLGHKLGEYIKENNVELINQTLRTLTEYCQGPCVENQRCILMHESNGIDMIRSLILDNIEPLDSLRMDLVLELKDNASKLLLALMESCSDPSHAARMLREPAITQKLIQVSIDYYHEQDDYDDSFAEQFADQLHDYQTAAAAAAAANNNNNNNNSSTISRRAQHQPRLAALPAGQHASGPADGMVRPLDVGHKVFILCHQLVQEYNLQAGQRTPAGELAKIPSSLDALAEAAKCELGQKPAARERHGREAAALRYYESHTAQIEIVRANRDLERVVFPVPQICEYLTHETKAAVFNNTDQDERGSKIPNFFLTIDELFDEMKWQRELQNKPILHSCARYMSLWSSVEFKLSCLVTVLVLFCVKRAPPPADAHEGLAEVAEQLLTANSSSGADTASAAAAAAAAALLRASGSQAGSQQASNLLPSLLTTLLAIAIATFFVFKPRIRHSWSLFLICITLYLTQVVGECAALKVLGLLLESVTVMHLFSVLINRGIVNKPLAAILLESDVVYHGIYWLICTLGLLLSPLFYPFLLPPSLIRREETLRNVIKSVTKNAYSILMTGFLGLIIILLYTIIDYLFFGQDFAIDLDDGSTYKPCERTLWECYVAHVNYGLRDGGGIGERIRDTRLDLTLLNLLRVLCIMSFFLVVNLMILQLVYCIIVDTFATLRGEKQQQEEVLRNSCFVCGLERSSFENRQVTFEEHVQNEHNLWHYLYFMVLIKIKSRTELSGPESYVHDMIRNKDHSWFPRMRAMSLIGEADG